MLVWSADTEEARDNGNPAPEASGKTLDPEAYVAENLEHYQNFAWTQSLCTQNLEKDQQFAWT